MNGPVAGDTQGYKILFRIVSAAAARIKVVDLEINDASAMLAAPRVPCEHTLAQPAVGFGVEPQTRSLRMEPSHAAFPTCSKNFLRSGLGKNSNSRQTDISSTSGFPVPRWAPARKSAQIISKQ